VLKYITRRVLVIPPLLLGVVTVTFLITRLIPANPLATVLNPRSLGNKQIVAAAMAHWGLNGSILQQFGRYLVNLLHGDMGTSFVTKGPVSSDIALRLPFTLELVFASIIIAVIGGIGIGVLAAVRQNKFTDTLGRLFTLVGSSTPQYWSGLVLLLILSTRLHLLPGPGQLYPQVYAPHRYTGFYVIDALIAGNWQLSWQAIEHLILPAFILGWGVMGSIARIVRASMLDVLSQDFVRTARAKGARETAVVMVHALRNALLPALTIIGFSVAYLLSGDVLVEDIFQWGGIGSYAVTAAESLDYPAIMGVVIVGGIAFLVASLLTDIGYAFADPQIRVA
jgi:ABC-type dipeptide/oligopeptide/nickel transport system permease component